VIDEIEGRRSRSLNQRQVVNDNSIKSGELVVIRVEADGFDSRSL
jgi:hypothetical protein